MNTGTFHGLGLLRLDNLSLAPPGNILPDHNDARYLAVGFGYLPDSPLNGKDDAVGSQYPAGKIPRR